MKVKKYDVIKDYERIAIGADSENYKKCACCGKTFFIEHRLRTDYAYKKKIYNTIKFCCSWTCYRKYFKK